MAETATKVGVSNEGSKLDAAPAATRRETSPFNRLRREIDRLFDDFGTGSWRSPFRRDVFDVGPLWRGELSWSRVPAVDIAETENGYEITAELPGIDENNLELNYADGMLTIKGEKIDEREEKQENHHLSERSYGSFRRSFRVPDGVNADKVEAVFKNGVLTVTLPKTPQAQKNEKRIEIKQG